jgi:ABC-type sugar transport system substrate-binding protein
MAAVMIEKELPVTAILADSVELALGAIDALRQHGRDVPPVVVPATLVKRSTCRPFRAEAHMVL